MTYFRSLRTLAFFAKYVNQSAGCIKVSFKPIKSFCKIPRTNDSNRQNMSHVNGAFYGNFKIEKLSESAVVIY